MLNRLLSRVRSGSRIAKLSLCAVAFLPVFSGNPAHGQTPLISGGAGFFSNSFGGQIGYLPILEPLVAVPFKSKFLLESRSTITESIFPKGAGNTNYDHSYNASITYLEGDYLANSHLTIVGGSFLIPFNTYNDRLSPIWISNFQFGPNTSSLGIMQTGTGLGGMLRGSAISRRKYSVSYTGYFSARESNKQFQAQRSSGGRVSLYMPEARLEVGFSYGRLLQGTRENFYGTHIWWEPKNTAFRLRSEYSVGQHAHGYWVEADYRTTHFGGLDSWVGRIEPVFRMQETFARDKQAGVDGLPSVTTEDADFGLNYNLPHNVRVLTSYSRQFSSQGNDNIWQTGVTYRFLFPAWKGK